MKILKSTVIEAATIQMEDWEDGYSENRYAVLWKAKDEENRYSARSLQDAEEYYEYRCLLVDRIEFREASIVAAIVGTGCFTLPNVLVLSGPTTRQYQKKLAEGGILIAVQVGKQKTAAVARKIFEDARCQEISEV